MDGAVCIVGGTRVVPRSFFIDIFQEQPRSVTALIVHIRRQTLMHDQPVPRRAVQVQFDTAPDFQIGHSGPVRRCAAP